MNDWQTWAALGVVVITLLAFVVKARRGKSGGCNDCGPNGCGPSGSGPDKDKS